MGAVVLGSNDSTLASLGGVKALGVSHPPHVMTPRISAAGRGGRYYCATWLCAVLQWCWPYVRVDMEGPHVVVPVRGP